MDESFEDELEASDTSRLRAFLSQLGLAITIVNEPLYEKPGYCYLKIFPTEVQENASVCLGEYPLLNRVREYALVNKISFKTTRGAIETFGDVIHIGAGNSIITIDTLAFEAGDRDMRVGGRGYSFLGKVMVVIPPDQVLFFYWSTLGMLSVTTMQILPRIPFPEWIKQEFLSILYSIVFNLMISLTSVFAVAGLVDLLYNRVYFSSRVSELLSGPDAVLMDSEDGSEFNFFNSSRARPLKIGSLKLANATPIGVGSPVDYSSARGNIRDESVARVDWEDKPPVWRPYAKQKVGISPKVDSEIRSLINEKAQSIEVTVANVGMSKHPVNSAFRAIAREVIKRKIPVGSRVLVMDNPSAWPLDGCVFNLATIDNRDPVRRQENAKFIATKRDEGHEVEFVEERLQDIDGNYDVLVCVHSCYDISPSDFFKSAYRLNVKRIFNVMIGNLSLLTDDFGLLPLQEMKFRRVKPDGTTWLVFEHIGESGFVYHHQYGYVSDHLRCRTAFVDCDDDGLIGYRGDVCQDLMDSVVVEFALCRSVKVMNEILVMNNHHSADICKIAIYDEVRHRFWFRLIEAEIHFLPVTYFNRVTASIQRQRNPTIAGLVASVENLAPAWDRAAKEPLIHNYYGKLVERHGVITSLARWATWSALSSDANVVEYDSWWQYYFGWLLPRYWKNISEQTYCKLMKEATISRFEPTATVRAARINALTLSGTTKFTSLLAEARAVRRARKADHLIEPIEEVVTTPEVRILIPETGYNESTSEQCESKTGETSEEEYSALDEDVPMPTFREEVESIEDHPNLEGGVLSGIGGTIFEERILDVLSRNEIALRENSLILEEFRVTRANSPSDGSEPAVAEQPTRSPALPTRLVCPLSGSTSYKGNDIWTNSELADITTGRCDYGRSCKDTTGTFLGCLFKSPVQVALRFTEPVGDVVDDIVDRHGIVLISKGFIYKRGKSIANHTIVIERIGDRFRRILPTEEKGWSANFSKLIDLDSSSANEFLLVTNHDLRSGDQGWCFYKAAATSSEELNTWIGREEDRTTKDTCSPKWIKDVIANSEIIVLWNGKAYTNVTEDKWRLPSGLTKVLVVSQHHVYIPNIQFKRWEVEMYVRRSASAWPNTLYLAGEVSHARARIEENAILALKLSEMELKISSPRKLSVFEALRYNIAMEQALLKSFDFVLNTFNARLYRATTEFWIYDTLQGRFLNGEPDEIFSAAWDGTDFIEVSWSHDLKRYTHDSSSKFLVMQQDLTYLRERKIIETYHNRLDELFDFDFDKLHCTLVDGVPGCGKTTSIVRCHTPGVDLVVTATKSANEDYLELKIGPKTHYRTYDSCLVNPVPPAVKMYADEGLMVHAGELLLVAMKVGCEEVVVYGDSKQIPFLNRAGKFAMKRHLMTFDSVKSESTTWRSPKCMIPILRQFYPDIISGSTREGTVSVEKIRVAPTLGEEFDLVMTFSKEEKHLLKQQCRTQVLTVHESQGKSYNNVALVRYKIQHRKIYDSEPHIIVAISRHKVSLKYFTVDITDSTSRALTVRASKADQMITKLKSDMMPVDISGTEPPDEVERTSKLRTTERLFSSLGTFIQMTNMFHSGGRSLLVARHALSTIKLVNSGYEEISIGEVQMFLDTVYEPVDELAVERMRNEEVFPLEPEFAVDYSKLMAWTPKRSEFCTPILRTVQPDRFSGSFLETVLAIRKRNLNPPMIHIVRDPNLIDEIAGQFFKTFIDDERLTAATQKFSYESDEFWQDWLASRTERQFKSMIAREMEFGNPNIYASHVKPDQKPKLDNTHNLELVAGQVLTVHDPLLTAKFSGVMRCMTAILKESLKPKWAVNDGMNATELNGFMDRISQNVKRTKFLEVDFSKFDKSQEEICLNVVCEILSRFGVPVRLVDEWRKCHQFNTLIFHSLGVKVATKFQRRSGDVLTFIGNTMVAMAAISFCYDLENAYGGVFGGDDSLIFMNEHDDVIDQSGQIGKIFNLIAKIENFPSAPMFSSRFLVRVKNHWMFVPDPVKVVVKLGRGDIYCKEHCLLYHRSFCDNLMMFLDSEVRFQVEKVVKIRYEDKWMSMPNDVSVLTNFIASLVSDKSKFLGLYKGQPKIWLRKLPSDMKDSFQKRRDVAYEEFDLLYEE